MNKNDFKPSSEAAIGIEAIQRGLVEFGISNLEDASLSDNMKSILLSNQSINTKIRKIKDGYERQFTLTGLIGTEAGFSYDKSELTKNKKFINQHKSGKNGLLTLRANSPLLFPINKRDLTETTGGSLTGTSTRPDLVELSNEIPTLQKLGVTFNFVDGGGPIQAIPTLITQGAGADVLNGAIVGTLQDPEFGPGSETAYLYTFQLPLSRKFFIQKNALVDELIKRLINNNLFDALMYRLFYGDTANGQCLGLYNNSNITKIASASFDESKGYALMEAVHSAEAPAENCLWVINSATEKLLKGRPCGSTSDRRVIERGLFLDKPYVLSERIAEGQVWYGAFQSVVLTLFNTEILVDQFSSSTNAVLIKLFQNYQSDVRHNGWIVCGTGVN